MKNKTTNYKVKYAIMKIERTLDNDGIYRNYIYYIPAKCYVIAKKERYLSTGEIKKLYDIVFITPSYSIQSELNIPEYNIYGTCTNSLTVDKIFDTYGEAKNEANTENISNFRKLRSEISYNKEYKKQLEILNNNYKLLNEYCNKIESYLLDITDEIKISYLPILPEEQINTILLKLIQLPLIQSDEFLCSLNEKEIGLSTLAMLTALLGLPFLYRASQYKMLELEQATYAGIGRPLVMRFLLLLAGETILLGVLVLNVRAAVPWSIGQLLAVLTVPFLTANNELLLLLR